ncbi:MAG: hypothetical protein ACXADY_02945 [Candidatus Hodarchaeales archaeon]|jgi:hypothetical protein
MPNPPSYTQNDIDFIESNLGILSYPDMAKERNLSLSCIKRLAKKIKNNEVIQPSEPNQVNRTKPSEPNQILESKLELDLYTQDNNLEFAISNLPTLDQIFKDIQEATNPSAKTWQRQINKWGKGATITTLYTYFIQRSIRNILTSSESFTRKVDLGDALLPTLVKRKTLDVKKK